MNYYFPAILSKTMLVSTISFIVGLTILLPLIVLAFLIPSILHVKNTKIFLIILGSISLYEILMCSIVFLCYSYAPKGYTIKNNLIMVHKHRGKIEIPFGEILNIRHISQEAISPILFWGNYSGVKITGIFGFLGNFHTKKMGQLKVYVSDMNKVVVLECKKGEKYLLSPDDPDKFISILKQRLSKEDLKTHEKI
jgi:hypothetical protein